MEVETKNSDLKNEKRMICPRISIAIFIRLLLIAENIAVIALSSCMMDTYWYFAMVFHILVIIVDIFYCSFKNHGDDFKWFSIAKYSYVMVMVSTISGVAQYKILYDQATLTNTSSCVLNTVSKACPITDMTVFVQWTFQIFLISSILATWALPAHGSITTEGTSAILLTYIAAGQDIAEFFSSSSADKIKIWPEMVNLIIIITFLSTIQFSITLAARRFNSEGKKSILDYLLGNEVWNIMLICLTQDLPFLLVRLALILDPKYETNSSTDYTGFFFLIKSAILVALEIYRIVILLREECQKIQAE